MKQKAILKKLEYHFQRKKLVRLTRKKGDFLNVKTGFIVDKSDDFILLLESDGMCTTKTGLLLHWSN